MAVPLLNHEEIKSLRFEKVKRNQKNYSRLKSIWAILFTFFIYMSVFYAFNLSPSSLMSTTKFWFFISNTLVVIIATDLSAFLKTTTGQDQFYDEYVKNHARASVPTFQVEHVKNNEKTILKDGQIDREEVHEKVIDMDHGTSNNLRALEIYKPQIATTTCDLKIDGQADEIINVEKKGKKKLEGVKCARSNSDKVILMAAVEENKERVVLHRTLSEGYEAPSPPPTSEENELSSISNEELNMRVEEFIRRFNRQIRLQAAKSRQSSSELN